MKQLDITDVLEAVDLVALAASLGGKSAQIVTERALTVSETELRKACKGMAEEDVKTVIGCFRRAADELSDGLVMIATKGRVKPD